MPAGSKRLLDYRVLLNLLMLWTRYGSNQKLAIAIAVPISESRRQRASASLLPQAEHRTNGPIDSATAISIDNSYAAYLATQPF